MKEDGYSHSTVNHSIEFKNKEISACTNLIESTWNAVKKRLPKYKTQKQLYDSYLVEYIIRKKYLNDVHEKNGKFLDLIKRVYPGKKVRQSLIEISNVAECSTALISAANTYLMINEDKSRTFDLLGPFKFRHSYLPHFSIIL